MPENEMTEVDETRDGQAGAPMAETRAQKYEREQLSRRAALRRMGYTSALAAFALFGVDDVVRLVGRRMQQQAGDSRVIEQVAREFQQTGIVMAGQPVPPSFPTCQHCANEEWNEDCWCVSQYGLGCPYQSQDKLSRCQAQATNNYNACLVDCAGSITDPSSGGCGTTTEPPGWSG